MPGWPHCMHLKKTVLLTTTGFFLKKKPLALPLFDTNNQVRIFLVKKRSKVLARLLTLDLKNLAYDAKGKWTTSFFKNI